MAVVVPTSQLIFGCRLLRQLLGHEATNVFVSPASVGLSLGMAASGAQGKTRSAIEQVLGVDAGEAARQAARQTRTDEPTPGVTVELANSLWARSGLPLSEKFVGDMRRLYRADVRTLDFSAPGAVLEINRWVSRATHGELGQLIDSLDAASLLVLVNATYFHGLWAKPFQRTRTKVHQFTTGAGKVTDVQMMHQVGDFFYAERDGVQAIKLPYRGGRFTLLIILPREPLSLSGFRDLAEPVKLAEMLRSLKYGYGSISLPRTGVDYRTNLTPALLEMGLGSACADDADFSLIFAQPVPARISSVRHRVKLDIDEEGTTATAAADINVSLGARISEEFLMMVDRPFLAVLSDGETEEVLFLGVLGDPAST